MEREREREKEKERGRGKRRRATGQFSKTGWGFLCNISALSLTLNIFETRFCLLSRLSSRSSVHPTFHDHRELKNVFGPIRRLVFVWFLRPRNPKKLCFFIGFSLLVLVKRLGRLGGFSSLGESWARVKQITQRDLQVGPLEPNEGGPNKLGKAGESLLLESL